MAQKSMTDRLFDKNTPRSVKITFVIIILTAIIVYSLNSFGGKDIAKAPDGTLRLHMIDVGQGDALLVESDGLYSMIDSGSASAEQELFAYLESVGVKTLEYAVFTHPHEDHIGNAARVVSEYHPKNIVMPDAETTTRTFEDLLKAIDASDAGFIEAKAGVTFKMADAKFTVLSPTREHYDGLNEYSVVLRLDYGSTSMLLTGDAETLNEKDIIASEYAHLLDCDLLKSGHHGSTTSNSAAFIKKVSPETALISVGAGNSYGHPHKEILKRFKSLGITVYRTDKSGTITALTDGKTITIETEK